MKNEPGNPIPDFAKGLLTFIGSIPKSLPPEHQMDLFEEHLRSFASAAVDREEPDDVRPITIEGRSTA